MATNEPSELLEVFVGLADPCCDGRTAIAGRYEWAEDVLTFLPAFGFAPGQDYIVRTRIDDEDNVTSFQIPVKVPAVEAAVTAIY